MHRRIEMIGLGLVLAGCITPFTSYQSARILPAGRSQVGVAVTAAVDKEADHRELAELMVRGGIGHDTDLGVKYAHLLDLGSWHFLQLDAKAEIVDGRAFDVAVGVAFSTEDSEVLVHVQPGFLFTVPIASSAEVDIATKVIVVGNPDYHYMAFAANLGLRVSTDLERWAFHPELGFFYAGDDDPIFAFGAGGSANF